MNTNTLKIAYFAGIAGLVVFALFFVIGPETASACSGNLLNLDWNAIHLDPTGQIPHTSLDGSYHADSATASKLCSLKGASLVTYTTKSYTSCWDNYIVTWNGTNFTQSNACFANIFIQTLTCCKTPECTPNATKQCSGNAVYWYDSCGKKGDLFQQCSTNQICQNAQCVNQTIACNTNADCGTNAYTGFPYCQGNNVYQNFITYTCQNPGTPNSQCINNSTGQLKQTCQNGCINGVCQTYGDISVQTQPATNITQSTVTLNGFLNNPNNLNCPSHVWFQYGTNPNFGNETYHMPLNTSGYFTQNVTINSWGTYYFRAVAQSCTRVVYGQALTFTAGQPTRENLTVSKTVKNINSGSGFSDSTYASPSDVLLFMITLRANNQDVNNIYVKDVFPANLIYKDQLTVACTTGGTSNNCPASGHYNYSGDITSGINLNTIYNGQTVTITYQAQVAPAINFPQGSTTLTNSVYVTTSDSGFTPTGKATVLITKQAIYGASFVPTGLTNNFLVDSFVLPLMLALLGIWMWKSGIFFGIERWMDSKKKNKRTYSAEKELATKIAQIQKAQRF